ncbi:Modification methylase MboII [Pirellula sp. SH-Sr6A]|uniref:site-specific DNA-methyltransferase n=1 Tax=Pirellula sp. SH-Sr6A TaxID=1632865 RepID=UPI00078C2782|nr:site-specific DNA-methyltransferase [Pirellula sp. SH-Sr6A]AMV32141.1 Modification methylase MboII [Pirellula sp. SH-Sr6A]
MTQRKQKLELTWIGKDVRPKLEPRILLEDQARSYVADVRVTNKDIFDNRLIFGDNLLALKALESEFTGKVKCVFIDPPYNTGSAFTHYDDGLEHSIWLGLMRDRLEIIKRLLVDDGSLWITIDDNEAHYLKVLCDEVFGRGCFVTAFIWKKVDSPNDNKVPITPDHEYLLCFTKTPGARPFKQKQDDSILSAYRKPDAESDRPYRDRLLKKNGKNSLRSDRPSMFFPLTAPDGTEVLPIHDDGREARWAMGKAGVDELIKKNELIWKKRENGWIPYTREYAPNSPARPYPTIWNDLDTTRQTKSHQKKLFGEDVFDTPKPEDMLKRVLDISTNPGDLVLDSFAGSGTTGAVAHKMGRGWIMIELGDHCHTHIIPRMKKVIDGQDPGGVTEVTSWKGGGGFRYFKLAPSLLMQDKWSQWVISKEYNASMLAEALCKLEGFRYEPSDSIFWMQGRSTETDFLYCTTQTLSVEQLNQISEEVGDGRTLLVLCSAFRGKSDNWPNLTVKKIPKAVLHKCEWGHDDYSLKVENLPKPPKKQRTSLFDYMEGGDE